jgi:hypothetical protein
VVTSQDFDELTNGVTQSRGDVANIQERVWFSNDDFLAGPTNTNATWLYNLQGDRNATLTSSILCAS